MLKRTLTGVALVIVLVPLLILGDWYFACVAAFIAYMANYELLAMFSKDEPTFNKLKYTMPIWSALMVMLGHFDRNIIIPGIILGILLFLIGMVINKNIRLITSMKLIFSYIILVQGEKPAN